MTTAPLELTFRLPCSAATAFAAWTDAADVTRWWREDGVYRTTGWTADVRPGGAWRADFEGDDGTFSAEGRYIEAARPTRLVWTWRASWACDVETTVDMTFDEAGDHTQLRLRHGGFASDEDRADNEAGWGQMIGWLIADLESR